MLSSKDQIRLIPVLKTFPGPPFPGHRAKSTVLPELGGAGLWTRELMTGSSPSGRLTWAGSSPHLPPHLGPLASPSVFLTHPALCTWDTPVTFLPLHPQGRPTAASSHQPDSTYHSRHVLFPCSLCLSSSAKRKLPEDLSVLVISTLPGPGPTQK